MRRGAITNLFLIVGVTGALASAEELGVATGSAEHDTPGRALRAGKCCKRASKNKRKKLQFRQKLRECEAAPIECPDWDIDKCMNTHSLAPTGSECEPAAECAECEPAAECAGQPGRRGAYVGNCGARRVEAGQRGGLRQAAAAWPFGRYRRYPALPGTELN